LPPGPTIVQVTRCGFLHEGIITEALIELVFGDVQKTVFSKLDADDEKVGDIYFLAERGWIRTQPYGAG
jgi:hypothetical protein